MDWTDSRWQERAATAERERTERRERTAADARRHEVAVDRAFGTAREHWATGRPR